jgi:hypothetical protein
MKNNFINSNTNLNTLDRELSIRNNNQDKKIKYIETNKDNFKDFYNFGNKLGQNYNTDEDSELRFSDSTRRKSLNKNTINNYKGLSRDSTLDLNSDIMSISSNEINNTAVKIAKASSDYWDNTKRRNLDTSIYTNNPTKIQGRGFGEINNYDLFLNGVGVSTRQELPDKNPRNVEDDRIFLTDHNNNYDPNRVTNNLPCGTDTRYLNKKII